MKTTIALAAAFALATLTTAIADPQQGGGQKKFGSYFANFGAGGTATNEGVALGGWTSTGSWTTKNVYGGADVDKSGVNGVYAGSHFATGGYAKSFDKGYGSSSSFTGETGSVSGGASVSWGKGVMID